MRGGKGKWKDRGHAQALVVDPASRLATRCEVCRRNKSKDGHGESNDRRNGKVSLLTDVPGAEVDRSVYPKKNGKGAMCPDDGGYGAGEGERTTSGKSETKHGETGARTMAPRRRASRETLASVRGTLDS